jgi:hypothetical protein
MAKVPEELGVLHQLSVLLFYQLMRMNQVSQKKSPAVAMAHASLFSQQAALKEAGHFEALIALQKEELSLRKDNEKQMYEERKSTRLVL